MRNFILNQTKNHRTIGVTRQVLLFMCFIAFTCVCFAQDIIITRDSRRIEAKVTEINVENIRYKQYSNQEGPTYTLPVSSIVSIVYQNGQVETFESAPAAPTTPATRNQTTPERNQQSAVTTSRTSQTNSTGTRRLSTAEMLAEMQANYPALYSKYNSGRRMKTTGWVLTGTGIAAFVIGFGVLVDGAENEEYEQADAGALIFTAGVGLIAGGVTTLAIGSGKRRRALNAFKNQYYSSEQSPHFQFNVYPNRVGLAYVF